MAGSVGDLALLPRPRAQDAAHDAPVTSSSWCSPGCRGSTSSGPPRCSRPPTRRSAGRPTGSGSWRRTPGPAPSSSGVTIVADEAIADVARPDRHADGRRAATAPTARSPTSTSSTHVARLAGGRAPGHQRVLGRASCSPRPGCSTAGAPPPTGACATSSPRSFPTVRGRSRPDLRARRQRVDLGRRHRRHGPRPRAGRGGPRPRRRPRHRPALRAVPPPTRQPEPVQRPAPGAGRRSTTASAPRSTTSPSTPTPTARSPRSPASR